MHGATHCLVCWLAGCFLAMAVHGSSRSAFLPSVQLPTSTACVSLCSSDHLSLAAALVDLRVLSLLVVLWPGHLGGAFGKLHVDLRLRRTGHLPKRPQACQETPWHTAHSRQTAALWCFLSEHGPCQKRLDCGQCKAESVRQKLHSHANMFVLSQGLFHE